MTGSRVAKRFAADLQRARKRVGWLDHLIRAGIRYDLADGGRLAAAVTYYAFFATFSLGLLGFAILGYVLDNPAVLRSVQSYLAANLPRLNTPALRDARSTAGLVALILLPVAGVWWVDSLRSSIRAIWRLPQYPGRFFPRQVVDLAVLVGLGLLFSVSLAAASGAKALVAWLLVEVAGSPASVDRGLLDAVGFVLGVAVNTLLAVAVLTGLPRLRMRPRRVIGPALLVAAGLEVIKTIGAFFIQRAQSSPAYQVVAAAVGLLFFLNVLNQLILFATALTATSTLGTVTDLGSAAPHVEPTERPLHITRQRPARDGSPRIRRRRQALKPR